jgi:hypothetical protein
MEAKVDRLSDTLIDQLVHRTSPMHGELLKYFSKEEHNIFPPLIPPWYVVEVVHNIARKEQLLRLRFTESEARPAEPDLQERLPNQAPPLSQVDLQRLLVGHFGGLSKMELVLELACGAHWDYLNQFFSKEKARIYPSFLMPHDICAYIEQKARVEAVDILKQVAEREHHQAALEARQGMAKSEQPILMELSELTLCENLPASEEIGRENPQATSFRRRSPFYPAASEAENRQENSSVEQRHAPIKQATPYEPFNGPRATSVEERHPPFASPPSEQRNMNPPAVEPHILPDQSSTLEQLEKSRGPWQHSESSKKHGERNSKEQQPLDPYLKEAWGPERNVPEF